MTTIVSRSHGDHLGDGWLVRWMMPYRAYVLLAGHAVVFALVLPLAYGLRFDWRIPPNEFETLRQVLPWVVLVKLAVFRLTSGHRGWWRYATFADVVKLAEVTTLCSVATVAVAYLTRSAMTTPRSVMALDWAGTLLVLAGIRCSTRLFRERYYPMISSPPSNKVLTIGATEAGLSLVRQLQSQSGLGMRAVGLLDADPWLQGQTLGGVKVLGTPADVAAVAERVGARMVLVPIPAVGPREIRDLVDACAGTGVRVRVVPGFDALVSGTMTAQPRDVDIEDLLCRPSVSLDGESIYGFLRGKTVLVTGAAGSIGSEICRQVLGHEPARLLLLDHSENGLFFAERELASRAGDCRVVSWPASVCDVNRVREVFRKHRPDVVFHAAAHKHVPMMEHHPGEAVKTNVFGTRTLLDEALAARVGAFVMVSTDKAVRATSVMGASKRLAEMYVQARSAEASCKSRLVTVRFGNVLGSNGSVVPIFKEQIRNGGPVTVTDPEMTRYFMTIPEATQLVLQAGALGHGGEIFVLDMGEPVRVVDLARDLIRLSGLTEGREIEITYTGLRPGEKLHEELYDAEERPLPTLHPKIFRARQRPSDLDTLKPRLTRLRSVTERPRDEVIAALRDAVPDYKPRPTGNGIPTPPVETDVSRSLPSPSHAG